jgi:hypothetical protein
MRAARLGSTLLLMALLSARSATATDRDPSDDCNRPLTDFGDAPEGVRAYPQSAVIGRFPTCLAPGAIGTRDHDCPFAPRSTVPGATGYVEHLHLAGTPAYWLGCYSGPNGSYGIDGESDGKVNTPSNGASACSAVPTDCVLGGWDQDECSGDGSDAGAMRDFGGPFALFVDCPFGATGFENRVDFRATNCGPPKQVYLNVCVDLNHDGDWNDALRCTFAVCAYEWAVKNESVTLPNGCSTNVSPTFVVPGSAFLHTWVRVSLTDEPVPDDYPWNGSAGTATGAFLGGETEDYLADILFIDPVRSSTWGSVKLLYR